MEPALVIDALSYTYPDGKQALQDISFSAYPGEKIAVVGANGAGKSTLLMHLNGLFQGEGQIWVEGVQVTRRTVGQVRGVVGIVFSNPDDQLFSPTVFEDVAYGPIYLGLSPQAVAERVAEALRAVDMVAYKDRNPYHLSSGEKKRIAIATVLAMRPRLLVFDEPTAGLDPRARRELIALLAELPQTLLIATHDLDMVRTLLPRTIILNGGKRIADGPSAVLLSDEKLLDENGLR